jgi:phosphonate dehydrogenase
VKPRVVVTHWVHPEVVDYLRSFAEPVVPEAREVVPLEALRQLTISAEGLLACMADSVDDDLLTRCPKLRIVSAALKGYDNFDVEACTRHGVWLTILPDLLTVPAAELAVGLLIAVLRRVPEGDALVRSGRFRGWRPQLYGTGLQAQTVGLVGMGRLGQAAAQRLRGFEVRCIYFDSNRLGPEREHDLNVTYAPFGEVLEVSDAIMPFLPLRRETVHLFDASALSRMKPGAVLVNMARGSIVDEEAVAAALQRGHLGGYAADVFEMEDWLRPGRPRDIPQRLLTHPRTIFTPHLGSAVDDVRRRMALAAARQIEQALQGERPEFAVNDPITTPSSVAP